ncbi:Ldh family oxidoreductase [Variovorax sp. MHTC-1]|uniref:Ldh family oxidoreductase n=1 Tax=Variovorax sp. MHTC-1 TaxID=2495593 RepID=UPI000F89C54E|nr:Ldh family oxidoreductase [Variovorax sp. MHTC-1]RST54362.1 malate/lactate/ureidoglycolate dehydrogenase [Variovorax sp. MHTC-1]
MPRTIQAATLRTQVAAIIAGTGSTSVEAEQVAANLVLANLSGHDSHGVGMVPRYVDAAAEGGLKPNASVKINLDTGPMLALDGQRGYGQIVGVQAMELAIPRAKQHGTCVLSLANAHHLGRIGHFAEMATAQGLVSMHFVNVLSRPVVAPWGGGDGRFGTNPCCIGIPLKGAHRPAAGPPQGGAAPSGGGDPHAAGEPGGDFILDYATSRVAQGKMRVAHNKGERVPPGYLIDEHGAPTDDPGVVVVPQSNGLFGALMTFGEHKGYGMAVACELLGGALTGGGTWHRPADTARTVLNGMLAIVIDPAKLGTQASFEEEASAFISWLRQSPPGQGFDAVQIAGEPERRARAAREHEGIWLDDATWGEIVAAGAKVGVSVG